MFTAQQYNHKYTYNYLYKNNHKQEISASYYEQVWVRVWGGGACCAPGAFLSRLGWRCTYWILPRSAIAGTITHSTRLLSTWTCKVKGSRAVLLGWDYIIHS